jgi:aminoglycoside phosphotransferase (APT) family kinase protein
MTVPSTDGFRPVLGALAAGAERYFGDAGAAIEPVARLDRPFSALLRLRVTAAGRGSHVFLKIYKPRPMVAYERPMDMARMVEDEFRTTLRLHTALAARPGLSAPRPISVFPEHMAIVTEEVVGTSFDRVLRAEGWGMRPSPMLDAIAARIGAWIREYQRVVGASGVLSLADQREYVDERLRHITPRILSAEDRARALGLFDTLAADVSPVDQPLVAIHADLCPGNILVTAGGGVSVLDFAMVQSGTRYHDVAHLFMHLERLKGRPRLRSAFVSTLQAALLRACHGLGPQPDPVFRLMLLQHAVCHVTQLADSAGGRLEPVLRWLIRRRWRASLAVPELNRKLLRARPVPIRPAHPRNLPIH